MEKRLYILAEHTDYTLWMYTAAKEELPFIISTPVAVWARSIEELHSYPPSFQNGVHPDDRSITREAMDRISNGEEIDREFRVNECEDFDRWVCVKGYSIIDTEGNVHRVAGFAREITELKADEDS